MSTPAPLGPIGPAGPLDPSEMLPEPPAPRTFTPTPGPTATAAAAPRALTETGLIVTPEEVARRLGITAALTETQRDRIIDAIRDAQADVEAELNRPIVPVARTYVSLMPRTYYGALTSAGTWTFTDVDDTVSVVEARPNVDGTFDVDVLIGLDGAAVPAITRFVAAAAGEALRVDPTAALGSRIITSVSAEGQSVSYAAMPTAADGGAGAPPTLRSLRAYKRRAVWQRPRPATTPWPYYSGWR